MRRLLNVRVATASAAASAALYYVGPEVGYDFAIKSLTLRAYAGVGMAHSTVSYSSSVTTTAGYPYGYAPSVAVSGSTGSTSLGLWPGFSVLYTIPQSMFFVGGDVRLLISTGSSLAEGILFERRVFHATFALDDQKEGMAAFAAKRKPTFQHK